MITQRISSDCTICCLAMLTGRTYEDVLAVAGDDFDPQKGVRYTERILKRLGYSDQWENGEPIGDFVCRYRGILSPEFFRGFAWGMKALISVPSLNFPDGTHMIFYDGREVFDPSPLKTYRKFSELLPDDIIVIRR